MNFLQNFVVQSKGLHNGDIVRKMGSYPEKMDTTPFFMGGLSAFTGPGNPVLGTIKMVEQKTLPFLTKNSSAV